MRVRYSLGHIGLEQMLRARHETPHPCNSSLTKLNSIPASNYTFLFLRSYSSVYMEFLSHFFFIIWEHFHPSESNSNTICSPKISLILPFSYSLSGVALNIESADSLVKIALNGNSENTKQTMNNWMAKSGKSLVSR